MRAFGTILLTAIIGASIFACSWLGFAFIFLGRREPYSTEWSGVEPFIIASTFLVIGAIFGAIIGTGKVILDSKRQ